jgi:hypothetical protein
MRLVLAGSSAARGEQVLCSAEVLVFDDHGMDDLVGVDPLAGLVPAHLRDVAERRVVHVEQYFVLALAIPDLAAGVARVGEDGAHGTRVILHPT